MTTTTPLAASAIASTTPSGVPSSGTTRDQLSGAAKQFEAIFVRQMLASARKADFGGEKLFSSQGMDTFRQMQDERFADIASGTGAFGMAKMIEAHLAKMLPPEIAQKAETAQKGAPTDGQ